MQKPNQNTAVLEIDAKAFLGEGAIWHPLECRLYWVNIEGKDLHLYNPATKENKTFNVGQRIGTVVFDEQGNTIVALQNGIHKINTQTGELSFIANPITDKNVRFNDGKCDPAGRFWVGTMHINQVEGAGSLYRIDHDMSIHKILDGVTVSNGITWSPNKKLMYYIDSPLKRVDVFEYNDETGKVSNRRTAFEIPDGLGFPDGMTIDNEGYLWIAIWGGSCVGKFDPSTGKMTHKINIAAPHVTSCAFGGENLDVLYITTARENLSDNELKKYPLSGSVFAVKLNSKGIPANYFKGKVQEKY
ncbi:MAG: SMP-30/gluconolactonase/LRE family protein [Chitinophagaceae bacterium]|nr:SMP-30/gluconolactonase/LRE family protein [Chitinophagaceae bacterium]